ncbi:MAG TPA: NAD(P)-dependent alcohol dehydrogenase [Cytophagales bacterium]|nr:NAD(P)-dependent alcohol dehydrogenase [Cytophagales bacterium]
MKAAIYEKYGSPSVLKIKKVEKPVPKNNEVMIRVYATTVNRTDCARLRAKPFIMRFFTGLLKPSNPVPGTDFAGRIEAVGKDVASLKVGDRVFGFEDIGLGTQAYYMTLGENRAIAVIPEGLSYEEAAASLEGVHYAYNFINKVELKSGEKVLVNGATGAIGSAAVQLLKYFGLHVTAVCSTKNLQLVKSIGANKVVDYTKEDFTKTSEKYHYVFDAVGKSTFWKCKSLLVPGGIYISSELGPMIQNPLLAMVTPLIAKIPGSRLKGKKVIFPIPSDCRRSVLLIKKLIEDGKFKAVIDRKYPLEEIAEAYRYVEKGEKTGNVVITLEDNFMS